jgi:predicted dehydrogenase/threonine dehydrogenase-like Zn-dependent dehydrogenase
MKQLLQDARTGDLSIAEVPGPQLLPGCVLVRTAASLVSAGTERASAEFARKNLLAKAKSRPDLVRDVMAKLQRDGLAATVGTVRSRLDQPQSVGYSSAGTVIAVGDGINDINVGDRVACAGAGYAVHAELACVPRLLVAKIPAQGFAEVGHSNSVSFEEAAFGTIGAICLHGLRTAGVALGDAVAVIGLGLLGQITVQLLKAAGCRVLGLDLLDRRANLAIQSGADAATTAPEEFRALCIQKTAGVGVDSVLITAETPSSDPVNLAAEIARDRAIVVSVGTVGMDLQRKLYYEKELDFRVSRSYGPGRYDTAYEQKGRDYPIGHVRWTETRNMEAFLRLIAEGKLDLKSLITHRFVMEDAARAYDLITGRAKEPSLGILLTYSEAEIGADSAVAEKVILRSAIASRVAVTTFEVGMGVLGAGNFAQNILLPALKSISQVSFVSVCNATGPRSQSAGEKFGFARAADSEDEILSNPEISAILIATRHHLHGRQVLAALEAGKSVFCEKPLCLSEDELSDIVRGVSRSNAAPGRAPLLMVGFNRRFAPMSLQLKNFLDEIHESLSLHYRVNAGYIPADHWVNDPEIGGGRIRGEVCHFVDFLCFLAGACPIEVQGHTVANPGQYSLDNVVAHLKFPNGTLGTITYMANGDKTASKERLEIFGGGSVAILEDFRVLELVRNGRKKIVRARLGQDKGHKAEMEAFVDALRGKIPPPIPFAEIVGSTLATLRLHNSCQVGGPLQVDPNEFMSQALRSTDGLRREPRN